MEIPKVKMGVIGGSTLWGSGFPSEGYNANIIADDLYFDTPFGKTAKFTYAEINGNEFLFVPYHGITNEILPQTPNSAFERVFYVFYKAGVKKIISSATCGSVDPDLKPGDFIVLGDFIDFTSHRALSLYLSLRNKGIKAERYFIRMRQPFCPVLSELIYQVAKNAGYQRVLKDGVVAVTEGPRFESPAEIRMLQKFGAHVVSHHMSPEVVFARELGACFAAFHFVSNYGEGLVKDWTFEQMIEHDTQYGKRHAKVLAEVISRLNLDDTSCGCEKYRTPWSKFPEE